MLTVQTLQSIHTDLNFDLFRLKVEQIREQLDVEEVRLPRKWKIPRCYEQGDGKAEFHAIAKGQYRHVYFEAIDISVTSSCSRFDQPGFRIYSNIEQLLLKTCSSKDHEEEIGFACQFYGQEIDRRDLES